MQRTSPGMTELDPKPILADRAVISDFKRTSKLGQGT
jgi:hypothetical protein